MLAAVLAVTGFVGQVQAQTASGNGYALKAEVRVVGIEGLSVERQAHVQRVGETAGFNVGDDVVGINRSSTLDLIGLQTGELRAHTQYIAPVAANKFAVVGTESSAASVDLGVVSLGSSSLLGLHTKMLTSQALVSGYCPPAPLQRAQATTLTGIAENLIFRNGFDPQNLQATGGSDGFDDDGSPGVTLSIDGLDPISIPLSPAPNTTIDLGTLGSLILNEQNFVGDGITSRGMEANAVHLTLTAGLVNAEVIISHSEAGLICP